MISRHWFQVWRDHIQSAKCNPAQADGYGRAAMIAQAEYVMFRALER